MSYEPKPLSPPVVPWTNREMFEIASRGLGKVALHDVRGMTLLSIDEITAMTGVLIAFGLVATLPGETCPADLIVQTMKGDRA
jgi:hypothetical protein